jgi:hypothetical protein
MRYKHLNVYSVEFENDDAVYGLEMLAETWEQMEECLKAAGLEGKVTGKVGMIAQGICEGDADEILGVLNGLAESEVSIKH